MRGMHRRIWAGCLALLLAFSCGDDESGSKPSNAADAGADVDPDAAEPCPTAPDIDETPAPDPGAPEAPPTLDCGSPTFETGGVLRRYPYLQSVTQTTAMVAWTAKAGTSAGKVFFGPSKDGPWTEFSAASEVFDMARTGDTEDYVAFAAAVTGLEKNKAYCYRVENEGTVVASGLKAETAWDGTKRPVRILAFGDSGNASPEQAALRDVFMKREFDVFLHLGDMAYGSGTFPEFEERVFQVYRDFMHRVPSFPTPGNHEYKTKSAQPYLDVYYLFEQALRARDQERYYSFDYGNVHFVSLDSNSEMLIPIGLDVSNTAEDDMVDWLEADLAGSSADWKVAFFHHPPWSRYEDRNDNHGLINIVLPVLERHGVDLVMVGHDHHYVRTFPVRGQCQVPGGTGAIPYIIVGSGGTGLHDFEDPDDWYQAAGQDTRHAFLSFTIHGCKGVGEGIDIDGKVFDNFEINGCAN